MTEKGRMREPGYIERPVPVQKPKGDKSTGGQPDDTKKGGKR